MGCRIVTTYEVKRCGDFKDIVFILNTTTTDTLTIDKDRTNLKDVTRLAKELVKQFKRSCKIFRSRRGHYHLEMRMIHTLNANLLIRLLAGDDPYRIKLDALRMATETDIHNTMFPRKLVFDLDTREIQPYPISRPYRTYVATVTP